MGRLAQFSILVAAILLQAQRAIAEAPQATMEKVADALPELEAYALGLINGDATPGLSIAIVFQDKVVYLKGFGVRKKGRPDPVDADTVFQLASASKPISSTIVAALVGDGTVSFDSRIAEIDPAFELSEAYPTQQLTIRDLFSHRSGLPGNAGNELEGLGFDRHNILGRLRLVRPANSFRAGYSYSNFGLTEGAIAAAKAAHMSFEDLAEAKLFKPLGMTSTSARYADFLSRSNRAELHVRHDGKWQTLAKRDPDAQAPAGGVSSSARDLAQWVRLELAHGERDGKPLIGKDAIDETHAPQISLGKHPITGDPVFYALGWNVTYGRYGTVWGHAGAFSTGARTLVSLIPNEQLGIVVLANAFPTGAPEAAADTFFDLVFKGGPTRDWLTSWNTAYESLFGPAIAAAKSTYGTQPTLPSPAMALSAYTGAYENAYLGEALVTEQDGALLLRLGPSGAKAYRLAHYDRDLFLCHPFDETPDLPSAVSFRIGPDGKAGQMTIEHLDELGLGTLARVKD